jgi:hypothetical protein
MSLGSVFVLGDIGARKIQKIYMLKVREIMASVTARRGLSRTVTLREWIGFWEAAVRCITGTSFSKKISDNILLGARPRIATSRVWRDS